jgi:NADH dehydrogenase (ubiquinone) Fe-S protein 7
MYSVSDSNYSTTAKPTTALIPLRAAQSAFISTSSTRNAEPVHHSSSVVQSQGVPPPSRKIKGEVPLASQEPTKGAIQYALYAFFEQ